MKKFSKLILAAMLVTAAVASVGCSTTSDKPAATDTASKEDQTKVNRAVFAAALLADSKLSEQFAAKKGLEGTKEVAYSVPAKPEAEAVDFLSTYWDKDLAKKVYEGVLGDKALLDKANAAFEAKSKADNAGKKPEEQKAFKPVDAVGDDAKIGANNLSAVKAKFEDAKITGADNKYTVEYKGLKYTVEKKDNSYKVTAKEGTLAK